MFNSTNASHFSQWFLTLPPSFRVFCAPCPWPTSYLLSATSSWRRAPCGLRASGRRGAWPSSASPVPWLAPCLSSGTSESCRSVLMAPRCPTVWPAWMKRRLSLISKLQRFGQKLSWFLRHIFRIPFLWLLLSFVTRFVFPIHMFLFPLLFSSLLVIVISQFLY